MRRKWGIKQRVLFLVLVPSIATTTLLGGYFTHARLNELEDALENRGKTAALRLATQGQHGVFSRDTVA